VAYWAFINDDFSSLLMIRARSLLLSGMAAALLAACAAHPPAPGAPPAAARGTGIYKVGNPYQIDGVWYRPAEDLSYDETGIASWYGEQFHGKYTANGEIFDLNALTAAHRTLPMPCVVEVINLENGRVLALRVNDRGPFARGRIIDVSRRAAQLLGFETTGTAKVRVKIMVPESIAVANLAKLNGVAETQVAEDVPQAAPRESVVAEALAPAPPPMLAPAAAALAVASLPPPAPPPLPETVSVVPVPATQIFVQVGAYSVEANALRVKSRVARLGPVKVYGARINGVDLYRVRLGPVGSVDEADQLLDRVVGAGLTEARIVVD
jgi:rare lipoprotein A